MASLRCVAVAVCVCVYVCVAVAGPTDPLPPTVSVDIPPPTYIVASSLKAVQPLLSCVGSGHALLTLREDWRGQFAKTVTDIGFDSIRYHAILDDDMSTYLNGRANMFNVFSTWDYFVSNQISVSPIVELSFMPYDLALDPTQTVFHYRACTSQPADWNQWGAFITDFVNQTVQRYGIEVVQNWKFEVWNEPNCGFLYPYSGCCPDSSCGPQDVYFKLYSTTSRAVKAVDSRLKVGGPATAQVGWLTDFQNYIASSGDPIDFLSTHSYPTDPNVPQDRYGFANTINGAAQVASDMKLDLIVTEFNAGLGIDASDGPYPAAFLIHQLLAFQNVSSSLKALSYWTFSDIFEEGGLISEPYNQQFGLQTNYGVPKPSYRAFQWIRDIRAMGGYTVQLLDNQGTVDVIALSKSTSCLPHPSKTANNQPLCGSQSVEGFYDIVLLVTNFNIRGQSIKPENVELTFNTFPSTAFFPNLAYLEMLDLESGNAETVWRAQGAPLYPNPQQIAKELAASEPKTIPLYFNVSANGARSLTIPIEPHSTARIKFSVGI